MADRYAPALFLEVLVFWLVLRWLLAPRLILFIGRILVVMMVVGAAGTLDQGHYVWAACFAGSALLAWALLRRWRRRAVVRRARLRLPATGAWRGKAPEEVATLCEQRIGLHVDAATPATLQADRRMHYVLALAGDALWVLEDESGPLRARIGRVAACWDRSSLIAHVEHSQRGERFEFSWPRQGALVRGRMPSGPSADLLAGHLVADEIALRS